MIGIKENNDELARKGFVSLVKLRPYGYSVLNDGYFVCRISATDDNDAISQFNDFIKTDWQSAWKSGTLPEYFGESLTKRSRKVSKRLSESVYEILYDYDDESGETYKNNSETFEGTWSDLQDYIKQMRQNGCYNIDANEVYDECTELKEADYSETDEFTLIKEMNHWIKDLKEFFIDDAKAQKAIADYFYYDDGAHQEDFKELQAAVKVLHKLWLKLDAITEDAEEKEYSAKNKRESMTRRYRTVHRNIRNGR